MTFNVYRGNKYRAKRTDYGGSVYHSKLEAAYAQELDLRMRAGDIKGWERQVRLDLRVNGQHICDYKIDFVVEHHDGSREYVECKGVEMPDWKLKWSLLEATFEDFRKHPGDRMSVVKQSSIRFK